MQWKWIGASQTLLQALSHQINPSLDSWINSFHRFGFDEKTTLFSLPMIDRVSEYFTFIAITGYSFGFSTTILMPVTVGYGLGVTASAIAGKVVDLIYSRCHATNTPSHHLLQGMARLAAFPAAAQFGIHYFYKPEISHQGFLFENRDACLVKPTQCQEEACQLLGVSSQATAREIKKKFQQLAQLYHPDRHQNAGTLFSAVNRRKISVSIG